jgi:hypothetical protein
MQEEIVQNKIQYYIFNNKILKKDFFLKYFINIINNIDLKEIFMYLPLFTIIEKILTIYIYVIIQIWKYYDA